MVRQNDEDSSKREPGGRAKYLFEAMAGACILTQDGHTVRKHFRTGKASRQVSANAFRYAFGSRSADTRSIFYWNIHDSHLFVPEALQGRAYEDHALPIGFGQTISQPYIVAFMSQLLEAKPGMKVLEIGTGSGYQAAVLREMGLEVFTIERVRELYEAVRELFPEGSPGIRMKLSDGTLGWRVQAPFDRIIVTAGGPNLPLPLLEQLADPGIMAIPVGRARREQKLLRVSKREGRVTARAFGNVAFVDLVGDHGW